MRAPRTALVSALALLLAMPLLAGCFGAEETAPTQIKATANDVSFSYGWAYDGSGITKIEGDATLDVNDIENTGALTATVTLGENQTYVIQFTSFKEAPDKPFQGGGIAFGLMEHGDTGNGDTLVPALHALAAGWGEATVTKNGEAFPDYVSGNPTWSAHFMLTDTGIRAGDGRMLTADKGGVYDPAAPGNGFSEAGDHELWLVIRNAPVDAAPAPVNFTASDSVSAPAPTYSKSFPLMVPEPGVGFPLSLAIRSASAVPTYQGSMKFTLLDASNAPVGEAKTLTAAPTGAAVTGTLDVPAKAGQYTLKVEGTNVANIAYQVEGVAELPQEAVLVFLFENVTLL